MIKRILVPLDGSGLAERALPLASGLASRAGAELLLLSAVVPSEHWAGLAGADSGEARESEAAEAYLQSVAEPLRGHGLTVRTLTLSGRAAAVISAAAVDAACDLIIMATHGRSGLSEWFAGSVADRVRHTSEVPVLLVHARRDSIPQVTGIKRILVPIGGSATSEAVLPIAWELAQALDARLLLVRVVPEAVEDAGEIREELRGVARRVLGLGVEVEVQARAGDTIPALLEIARDHSVDMIAMATHGNSPAGMSLNGGVADAVSHDAELPCLIARGANKPRLT